jgi:hypothetical protein
MSAICIDSSPLADVVQCGLKGARLGPICHPTLP